jgi:hypothetical protein
MELRVSTVNVAVVGMENVRFRFFYNHQSQRSKYLYLTHSFPHQPITFKLRYPLPAGVDKTTATRADDGDMYYREGMSMKYHHYTHSYHQPSLIRS